MTATAELNAPLTIGARLLLPARRAFSFARPLPVCVCRALPSLARRMSRVICAWTMTARALSEQILFPLSARHPYLPSFLPLATREEARVSFVYHTMHERWAAAVPRANFELPFPHSGSPLAISLPSLARFFPPSISCSRWFVRAAASLARPLPLVTVPSHP